MPKKISYCYLIQTLENLKSLLNVVIFVIKLKNHCPLLKNTTLKWSKESYSSCFSLPRGVSFPSLSAMFITCSRLLWFLATAERLGQTFYLAGPGGLFGISKETVVRPVVLRQWSSETEIHFFKRVDKGWIAIILKDLDLWRRANARNVSFLIFLRRLFSLYQLVW